MNHHANREQIFETLRQELVGPAPRGEPYDFSGDVYFGSAEEAYRPYQQLNGEEVVGRDAPIIRYGVGVLYPLGEDSIGEAFEQEPEDTTPEDDLEDNPDADQNINAKIDKEYDEALDKALEKIQKRVARDQKSDAEPDDDELETPTYKSSKPSSLGVSFLTELPDDAKVIVTVSGGRYEPKSVQVMDKEPYTWWLRKPVQFEVTCSAEQLEHDNWHFQKTHTDGDVQLSVELFSRSFGEHHLITATLVNRTAQGSSGQLGSSVCLFQSAMNIAVEAQDKQAHILPYPTSQRHDDSEEQSLALLYRKCQTYAVGHGCAADWSDVADEPKAKVYSVRSASLPSHEVPSITPDITRADGTPLVAPMALLAGLVEGQDGLEALQDIIDHYDTWIAEREQEANASDLAPHRDAATRHLDDCRAAAVRMREGLAYLKRDAKAKRAFQLANHAILLQQVQSKSPPRKAKFDKVSKRYTFSPLYSPPEILKPEKEYLGTWRAFQIAFLLMSLQSAVEGTHEDRKRVELIWFPTGGGKTEAYLGLTAFTLFMRRLQDPSDGGVHVLMRYTLRLLTAQQFQRAATLICAMETLRREHCDALGEDPFSIGIWLGGSTTPNKREAAQKALRDLEKNGTKGENPFILTRCPWCQASMGVYTGHLPKNMPRSNRILGYKRSQQTVLFFCKDKACDFHTSLPVYVIDEDIYDKKPSLVIGTVDKFAVLAWKPEARSLFGINKQGKRDTSPPGLIIQDELHLISGPLGSMVGLYEALIEELCTDRRSNVPIPPKLVCSTATIRSYQEQIKALYARDSVTLFPPPGLEDGDSFFAKKARDNAGNLQPGKRYVGINAPGLRSIETSQERTFAALLQASMPLSPEERDPWWTLLVFFGSLRELGTSLSIFQTRVPDYLEVMRQRWEVEYSEKRKPVRIEELTSRLRNHEVPEALAKLEIPCTPKNMWSTENRNISNPPVDVCLSSSIIEVGVDIDRLSLMAVVRQPKTTSQYIQVTGRVGRKWWERPGLVVTLFNPKNARDISHFEHFRSYHEKLYAQVEPTSVTPFSPAVLDRALHGVMAAYALQVGSEDVQQSPHPYPENLIDQLKTILMPRVCAVDPQEVAYFEKVFDTRADEWRRYERTNWYSNAQDEDPPLMMRAGEFVSLERQRVSWRTPTSMRNVDAECQVVISNLYLDDNQGDDTEGREHV